MESEYFEVKITSIKMDDEVFNKTQTFVTPKGLNYIREKLEKSLEAV
jgi:hypothetical protein